MDRILLGLKKTGFDNFARVGNLQRIDKRLLPHAVFPRFFAGAEAKMKSDLKSALKDCRCCLKSYVPKPQTLNFVPLITLNLKP